METIRLSTKGQMILPKRIRTAGAWGPGTKSIVEDTADGILLRPASRFPETKLQEVAGCLQFKGRVKTVAQMRAAIERAVNRRGRNRC